MDMFTASLVMTVLLCPLTHASFWKSTVRFKKHPRNIEASFQIWLQLISNHLSSCISTPYTSFLLLFDVRSEVLLWCHTSSSSAAFLLTDDCARLSVWVILAWCGLWWRCPEGTLFQSGRSWGVLLLLLQMALFAYRFLKRFLSSFDLSKSSSWPIFLFLLCESWLWIQLLLQGVEGAALLFQSLFLSSYDLW